MNKAKMNSLMILNIEDKVRNRFTTEELEWLKSIVEVELYERDAQKMKTLKSLNDLFEEYESNITLERA